MKKLSLVLAICMVFAGMLQADVFEAGGDRLTNVQNNDGGWDWSVPDDGNPSSASPKNTVGPIGMGLAAAYKQTGDAAHLAALVKAGNLLIGKSGNFSPSDGYLAVELDNIFGVTTYSSYVKANFYDKLAAGTYAKTGAGAGIYNTAGYVNLIRNSRAVNLGTWDIGMGLYAASLIGADTSAWVAGTKAEIDIMDSSKNYDVIGLAGAIMGLAAVNEDYNPTAGAFAAASSISDLANILTGYQMGSGAFTWNSAYVGDGNEAHQETAYAILALDELGGYDAAIAAARNYLVGVQLATGGWEGYLGANDENNEVTGEVLWAIPEPATMSLLIIGAVAALRKRK